MRIVLFTQFYTPKDEHRRSEIDTCLRMNVLNPSIDEVHVLLERPEDRERVPASGKVKIFDHPPRMTYGEWLQRTQQLLPGDVSILVNSDIHLDESIERLRSRARDWADRRQFLALTRYNPKDGACTLNGMPQWTQDTWIVSRGSKPFPKGLLQEAAFELGYPGCDNKIAYVMHSYGFGVSNPCLDIRSIHLQADERRSYDDRHDKLIGLHAFVHPAKALGELSALEFELLTRSEEDPLGVKVNHWINRRSEYFLRGDSPNQAHRPVSRQRVEQASLDGARFEAAASAGNAPLPPLQPPQQPAPPPTSAEPAFAEAEAVDPAGAGPFVVHCPRLSYIRSADLPQQGLKTRLQFLKRFALCEDEHSLYWTDSAWTGVAVLAKKDLPRPLGEMSALELFVTGFAPPAFELFPTQIATQPRYQEDALFWQYPARTEQDAWERITEVRRYDTDPQVRKIYVGLPWATFIDRENFPDSLLLTIAARIRRIKEFLAKDGLVLQVHTVCQHVFWERHLAHLKKIGITDLWISHKTHGEVEADGIRLHAWVLFPVNLVDPARQQGLQIKMPADRETLACFTGAHMEHYLSNIRLRLKTLAGKPGYQIAINDIWHFNKAVYDFQMIGKHSDSSTTDADAVLDYNRQLSNSVFSLCPVGAGPNTIRLWESLGAGSIPVMLSDTHELPDLALLAPGCKLRWEDAVIIHPEAEIDALDQRLRSITPDERDRLQRNGRSLHHLLRLVSPLGKPAGLLQHIAVIDRFKPQQVQALAPASPVVDGRADWKPISIALDGSPSARWVYFDSTERLLGLEAETLGIDPSFVEISTSLAHRFGMTLPATAAWKPRGRLDTLFLDQEGSGRWAIGIKVEVKLKQGASPSPGAHLVLRPLVAENLFANTCRLLDEKGVLAETSAANPLRKDDLFDTLTIESGACLDRLSRSARIAGQRTGGPRLLFPYTERATHNLAGEALGDGITLYVHLMNRNANVRKNFRNWLGQKIDELILLDWSSEPGVASIPGLFDDPRVRVVRVEGQKRFVRTWAQNLASRMARHRRIFKCDSDVTFTGDFFAAHPLLRGEFWVGDWRQGRDLNERHLHGETYYHIDDFNKVNGYDERITSYGQDDTNLKDRMVLAGLVQKVLHYNQLHHEPHDNAGRTTNQKMLHPMVNTYYHRMLVDEETLWGPGSKDGCRISIDKISARRVACTVTPGREFAERADLIERAIETVASWYTDAATLGAMSREARIALIWEKSLE